MRAGYDDLRPLKPAVHTDDIDADTLPVPEPFSGHLLAAGKDSFHVTHCNMQITAVTAVLLDYPCDQLALLPGKGTKNLIICSFTEKRCDHLAGNISCLPAEIARGIIILIAEFRDRMRVSFGRLLRDLVLRPNRE